MKCELYRRLYILLEKDKAEIKEADNKEKKIPRIEIIVLDKIFGDKVGTLIIKILEFQKSKKLILNKIFN